MDLSIRRNSIAIVDEKDDRTSSATQRRSCSTGDQATGRDHPLASAAAPGRIP
jgi:hypothetical protein